MRLLSRVASLLLDALAPPCCAACDEPSASAFCATCGPLSAAPEPRLLDGAPLIVLGRYEPPLSDAIVRFKYGGHPELARGLGQLLARALELLDAPAGTTLVPVPLHPRRLATRGYNQAALLAQELGHSRGLPCEPRLLLRTRDTEHQVGKARAARLGNATDAFALRKAGPRRVVLVDDVVTTGSTIRACAQTLALGGIEVVAIAALAEASAPR
ncbi:MAG TPA: phosphoribosyltransferase family protein [Polyangiaceae bacterium]|nr:phosphoribosyltransferase family protein [Polyangiaceae bacterium]